MRTTRVLNPPLLYRSIGIAAAQAFAFTTTDPGACTPRWTIQSNPRRCVVDTDGLVHYKGRNCGFKAPSEMTLASWRADTIRRGAVAVRLASTPFSTKTLNFPDVPGHHVIDWGAESLQFTGPTSAGGLRCSLRPNYLGAAEMPKTS
jgi:hypothetical protein